MSSPAAAYRATTAEQAASKSAEASATDAFADASVLMALGTAAAAPHQTEHAWQIVLPPGYTRCDITDAVRRAAPVPTRKSGTVQLLSLQALRDYLADQAAQTEAVVYADADHRTITAVFNDHRATPGWRDHRAVFKAELSQEFSRWAEKNGKPFSQTEFAEFIEDNLADITEPAAQQLLEVATTIQATSGIEFKSARRLQDGQTQMAYVESINATAGASGGLQIPRGFALGLRIFRQGAGYKLHARLKYRLSAGAVKFWFELERPEAAIDHAFAEYVAGLADTGYLVLAGRLGE